MGYVMSKRASMRRLTLGAAGRAQHVLVSIAALVVICIISVSDVRPVEMFVTRPFGVCCGAKFSISLLCHQFRSSQRELSVCRASADVDDGSEWQFPEAVMHMRLGEFQRTQWNNAML
mmetsp:Transcript_77483/g.166071  ORF Transcript_77483/g.166071 Transcript_77483/m.166071 type:complete len:118 (-) Transcript_77483:8-361(-)